MHKFIDDIAAFIEKSGFKKGNVRSVDWESFSGTTKIPGTPQAGSIEFEMRTGRMVSRKNGPDRYIPDIIHMVGIEGPSRIEEICRKRIKENDPTPSQG